MTIANIWDSRDVEACRRFALSITQSNHDDVRTMRPRDRRIIGDLLAASVRSVYSSHAPSAEISPFVDALNRDGLVQLGRIFDTGQASDIVEYFRGRPCYNRHVYSFNGGDQIGRMTDGDAPKFEYGCYPKPDIFGAPHLIEALTSERVLDICEGYLGARPMLFSLNVYWSFPGHAASAAAQDYHRDMNYPRFCVLFVYLNDVGEHNGPHEYIIRTHDVDQTREYLEANGVDYNAEELFMLPSDGYGQDRLYRRLFGDQILTIAGPAGTAFIEDTYGLHRGRPPQDAPRLAAWARYTLFPSPPSLDPVSMSILGNRYPSDERRQYALRPLVQ